jgi:hypothetical protein
MTFAANVWTVTTFAGLPGVAGSSDGQGARPVLINRRVWQ